MRFLSYLVTLLFASLIAACGGGGGSPGLTPGGESQAFFTTAPGDLILPLRSEDSLQEFTVGGGRGPFTASSTNRTVVTSAIDDKTLTLGAVGPGTAIVTLRDSLGATTSVNVTVQPARALFTTAPATITLPVQGSQTFTVGGGVVPYTVVSGNSVVASAVLDGATGTKLTITGLASGTSAVQVLDAIGGTTSITVQVPTAASTPLFTTAPAAFTLGRGLSETFSIGGGSTPYTVTSSNNGIATGTLITPNTFRITGVANGGPATITVRDSNGTTSAITVTVAGVPLVVNPEKVSAFIGDTVFSTITGGTGPFSIVQTFPDAADVTVGNLSSSGVFTANSSGNVLKVVVKQVVSSDGILVRDATGAIATFTLTSTAGTNGISLSPSSLTISGGAPSATVTLMLFGATGPVNLFSSDPAILSVTTPVTGSASGTAVTISKPVGCVSGGASVIITAIDAAGAKATATVTLQEPAAGCPLL